MSEWRNRIVGYSEEAPDQLLANPKNWRSHPGTQADALRGVLDGVGVVQNVLANKRTGYLIDGHLRVMEALKSGQPSIPVTWVDLSEEEEALILATLDPLSALAGTDAAQLEALLHEVTTDAPAVAAMLDALAQEAGIVPGVEPGGGDLPDLDTAPRASLADRFGVPPFSVLDARQGYWQARKRAWLALGIESELGRGDNALGFSEGVNERHGEGEGPYAKRATAAPGGAPRPAARLGPDGKTQRGDGRGRGLARSFGQDLMRGEGTNVLPGRSLNINTRDWVARKIAEGDIEGGMASGQSGTSIFDPVLCELVYRWFTPAPGAAILDPFAGGSVRGIVAARLGYAYTGIDLRPEQIAANEEQAQAITPDAPPRWIVGDSREASALAPGTYDLIFSCPPYADLEVYSDDPRDLSTLDYPAFLDAYRAIIAASVGMLAPNRFACFVVGDVRDPKGLYRNFVGDTVAAFHDAGARLYNEAILVTAVGSLPIRIGKQFEGYRKLGKTHQNVLAFFKGDPRTIKGFGPVEFGDLAEQFGEEAV